jgi:hypothetical protein
MLVLVELRHLRITLSTVEEHEPASPLCVVMIRDINSEEEALLSSVRVGATLEFTLPSTLCHHNTLPPALPGALSEDEHLSDLSRTTRTFQVTYANIKPMVAHVLEPKQFSTFKTFVLIGEAIDASVLDSRTRMLR